MNPEIKKTKAKLAITFVVVIFVLISILGTIFFIAKYYRVSSNEKNFVHQIIHEISTWEKAEEKLQNITKRINTDRFLPQRKHPKWPCWPRCQDKKKVQISNTPTRNFNYIHFDKNYNILSVNIRWNIDSDYLEDVIEKDDFLSWQKKDRYYVKKVRTSDNWLFILLLNVTYWFDDLLSDLLGFLFINWLFSIALFFVGKVFINKSFSPLESNMNDMKNFVHNAWHELKTPIAVIDSNLQLFKEIKTYDDTMVWEMREEVSKLNSLIESLVKLSDIDNFKEKSSINLKELVEEIVSDFWSKISEKDIHVSIDIPEKKTIIANKDYIYIFIANIIWNAIKYNKKSWEIIIKMDGNKLQISDNWIGISDKNIWKIFNRFFKWDESRNSEWFGIWLSLVKKIADIYKWKIMVSSKNDDGTTFIVTF